MPQPMAPSKFPLTICVRNSQYVLPDQSIGIHYRRMGAPTLRDPQFVTHDYIDLDKITYITKFRSGSGHDYSDDYESCRNMKHYFQPNVTDWSSVNIYSPVDGTIIDLEDSNGIQVTIQSSAYPAYKFIIFHVDILPHITKGYSVSAGEQIGNHINNSTNSDIAVRIFTIDGSELKKQLVSFFDVMTDTLFASYQARGISSRTDLIITAAQRDADPLHCSGESFYLEEGEEQHPDGGYKASRIKSI